MQRSMSKSNSPDDDPLEKASSGGDDLEDDRGESDGDGPDGLGEEASFELASPAFRRAAAKVREFPTSPGLYLLKDSAGRVIYVGKAKNLRSRASSYFLKGAAEERRTASWIKDVCDAEYVACDSEVDALLVESRLIKDIAAEIQQGAQGRQDVPLPDDFDSRGLSPRRGDPRAAAARRQALRPVRQRRRPARSDPSAAEDLQVSHLLAGHRRGR